MHSSKFSDALNEGRSRLRWRKVIEERRVSVLASIRAVHEDCAEQVLTEILRGECRKMVSAYRERDGLGGVPDKKLMSSAAAARKQYVACEDESPPAKRSEREQQELNRLRDELEAACNAAGTISALGSSALDDDLQKAESGTRRREIERWDHAWAVRDHYAGVLHGREFPNSDTELTHTSALSWMAFVRAGLSARLYDNQLSALLLEEEGEELASRRVSDDFILGLSLRRFLQMTMRLVREDLPQDPGKAKRVAARVEIRNSLAIDERLVGIGEIALMVVGERSALPAELPGQVAAPSPAQVEDPNPTDAIDLAPFFSSDCKAESLTALQDAYISSDASRKNAGEIAGLIADEQGVRRTPQRVKEVCGELVKAGVLKSRRGPSGGFWMTEHGREVAKELRRALKAKDGSR